MAHLLYFLFSQLEKKKGWNKELKWSQCEVEPLAIDIIYLLASDVLGVLVWLVPLMCIYILCMHVCIYILRMHVYSK